MREMFSMVELNLPEAISLQFKRYLVSKIHMPAEHGSGGADRRRNSELIYELKLTLCNHDGVHDTP